LTIPKGGKVRLKQRPWVVQDSVAVLGVEKGTALERSSLIIPQAGTYRVGVMGMLRFSPEDVGRAVRVSYKCQAPRVAVLPIAVDGGYDDVRKAATARIEKYFEGLQCEVDVLEQPVPGFDPCSASQSTGDDIARKPAAGTPDAALFICCSVRVEEIEGTGIPVPPFYVVPKSYYWTAQCTVNAVDVTGQMWGGGGQAVNASRRFIRGISRRQAADAAVETALKATGLTR